MRLNGSLLAFVITDITLLPRTGISIWQKYGGNLKDRIVKRDRQRSLSANAESRPEYNPYSTVSYLSRLRTFTLPTYPTKPSPSLSPQACAQAGWFNRGGKDRLVCEVCQKAWRVELPSKKLTGGITLSPEMSEWRCITLHRFAGY